MGEDQKRAVLAVLISGLILFGWNHYFGPKKKETAAPQSVAVGNNVHVQGVENTQGVAEKKQQRSAEVSPTTPISDVNVGEYSLAYNENKFFINNDLTLKSINNELSTVEFKSVVGVENAFELFADFGNGFQKLVFNFQAPQDSAILVGSAQNNVNVRLEARENGRLRIRIDSQNPAKYMLQFNSVEFDAEKEGVESTGPSFLGASSTQKYLRRYIVLDKDVDEVTVGSDGEGEVNSKWLGVDSNYHLFAFVFNKKRVLQYKVEDNGPLVAKTVDDLTTFEGDFVYTKKIYDDLKAMGDNLHMSVDFGVFSIIAVPLFKGLQYIHAVIPNWGLAIILLTLLIRFATFPLYMKQMKSMNKMKKLQPQMAKLKEKFKDDPKRQQMETMELFKRNKVNPVGGCLPLILQMPVFIAFYKVLTVSGELDGQAFVGWIANLTAKDPYYVLPILVALVMFLNQRLMPTTTTDPAQQKVMQFFPVIFAFIFINMPAGLNIYILVSTAFGIAQQLYVNKTAS